MFTRGISVYPIFGLIIINLSGLISGEKERFANFYAAPGNLELIAMASEHSSHHQRASPRHSHDQNHHQQQQQHRYQSQSRPEYRGKSSAPPPRRPSTDFSSDEPRFSIGLGTLAPSYSQKFGVDGRTRLDFDHRANGFSYSLTNNHHPEPEGDQKNYESSPQDQKSADANVKIYYDQRFSPYAAAETNNYISRVPFNQKSFSMHPLQDQHSESDNDHSSHLSDIFSKYAPKSDDRSQEYNEESSSSNGPGGPFDPEPQSGPPASGRDYQNDMFNPRFDENQNKQGSSEFPSYGASFMDSSADEEGADGYNYPLPFQKKDSSNFLNSHPEGSLEFNSGSGEINGFSHNSNAEPVVFSPMVKDYSGLDSNDAFSAYIAGLPLTP